MILISYAALKKPNVLYISLTHFARTFKGNPFLYFQFEDLKAFQLFKFQGHEIQIFGPKKESDSVLW